MKTKEFIERVEKLGYKTVKVYSFITICDPDNMDERVAVVSMRSERQLSISDAIYGLTKLLITYADTPLAEREDEKKYYVKVFNQENSFLNMNVDNNLFVLDESYQSKPFKTQFTKSEIKQLEHRDDIPLDWGKVKLIEVDDD